MLLLLLLLLPLGVGFATSIVPKAVGSVDEARAHKREFPTCETFPTGCLTAFDQQHEQHTELEKLRALTRTGKGLRE